MSSPIYLTILPEELYRNIKQSLDVADIYTLRLTCKHFYDLIEPATHKDLLGIEASLGDNIDHFACVGCTKIRPRLVFSPAIVKKKKVSGGADARNRFWNDCGRRPLPGVHRFMLGSRWEEYDMKLGHIPFVRCSRCREIARAPKDKAITFCLACHTYNLERIRAAEEVKRVQNEMREKEERTNLREEQRVRWIANGRAASEFSDYNDREDQDDYRFGDDPNDWSEEFAMNYSDAS